MPQLTLAPSAGQVNVNDQVTFTTNLTPPANGMQVEYHFPFSDGTPDVPTSQYAAVHQFAAAGDYRVAAYAVVSGRWTVKSEPAAISAVPLPATTTETTGTVPPTQSSPPPVTPPPAEMPWSLIAAGAVAAVILGAVARAALRKPRASTAPPTVSIRSGLGATNCSIEDAEQIRRAPSVRVRAGVRSAVVIEGDVNV
jgi:hypothetical protein